MFTREELSDLIAALREQIVEDWRYLNKYADDDEVAELQAAIARREALLKKLRVLEDNGL